MIEDAQRSKIGLLNRSKYYKMEIDYAILWDDFHIQMKQWVKTVPLKKKLPL